MQVVCRDLDDVIMLHNEGVIQEGAGSLGHKYVTTPSVINAYGDSTHPAHQLINSNLIFLMRFSEEQVLEVSKIFIKNKNSLSFTDCTCIYCAIVTNGVLISNEKVIITACITFQVKTFTTVQYCEQIKLKKTG